jgi:hypothetical protein
MGHRSDHRGQLGLDQSLVDRRCCLLDPVFDIGALERLEHVEQGRLIQSHRVVCPFARTIGVGLADHHTMASINVVIHADKAEQLHHERGRHPPTFQGQVATSATSIELLEVHYLRPFYNAQRCR